MTLLSPARAGAPLPRILWTCSAFATWPSASRSTCRAAKRPTSAFPSSHSTAVACPLNIDLKMTRGWLDELVEPLIDRPPEICEALSAGRDQLAENSPAGRCVRAPRATAIGRADGHSPARPGRRRQAVRAWRRELLPCRHRQPLRALGARHLDVLEDERRRAARGIGKGIVADGDEVLPEFEVIAREVHLGKGFGARTTLDEETLDAE